MAGTNSGIEFCNRVDAGEKLQTAIKSLDDPKYAYRKRYRFIAWNALEFQTNKCAPNLKADLQSERIKTEVANVGEQFPAEPISAPEFVPLPLFKGTAIVWCRTEGSELRGEGGVRDAAIEWLNSIEGDRYYEENEEQVDEYFLKAKILTAGNIMMKEFTRFCPAKVKAFDKAVTKQAIAN